MRVVRFLLALVLTVVAPHAGEGESAPVGDPPPVSDPAPNVPSAEDVLSSSMVIGRGGGTVPRITYDNLQDFGTAFKGSVMPLVTKADDETPPIPVAPWYPISGYKLHLTWRPDSSKYFTGETLMAQIGTGVYGVNAALDAPISQADSSMGSFRDYYGGRYNHLQPGIPAKYSDALPDNKLTSASIENVLDLFPWSHPTIPGHKVTEDEFKKLKKVYYNYIADHTRTPYTSLILPFAVKGITAPGAAPLIPIDQLISNFDQVKTGARPVFKFPAGVTPEKTPGGQGRFTTSSGVYAFKVSYTYYFQNAPSKLDIDQNGAGGGTVLTNRNNLGDFDGPMAVLSGGTITSNATNGDNVINTKLNYAAGGEANVAWLETLATTPLPAETVGKLTRIGYDPDSTTYFKKMSHPGVPADGFFLSGDDILSLNDNPDASRLTVSHAPHPTVAFNPQHFADEGPVQMENYLRTANPPVAPRKVRQGSMQVYVVATAEVYKNTLLDENPGTLVAKYKVVDDVYVVTPFVRDQYLSAADLNAALLTDAARGGTYVKDGDPYDRLPDFSRIVIPTPARVDTRNVDPGPSDHLLAAFPDPRTESGRAFLAAVAGKEKAPERGNPNSLGNAFFEAHVGRGPAFNYVYDRDGAQIDPTRLEPPQKYWANPRHVAIVWPYRVKTPAGTETTVGPYVMNLTEVQRAATANPASAKYVYQYAQPPWHDSGNTDIDKCTPVVLAEPLRGVVNKLFDGAGNREIHMTAEASDKWGKPQAPGNDPDYRYTADLSIVDANKEGVNSLLLRVPCSDAAEQLIPIPGSFVPLSPAFPTFQGQLTDEVKAALSPPLTAPPAGVAPKANQYFVAAYDARIRTSGGESGQTVPVPGLPAESRTILSANSVDQTVKAQVVDGCGRITTLAGDKVSGVPLYRPSASVTFLPSDDPSAAYTVGVPIAAKYFVQGNEGAKHFTAPTALSLGSRINDLNRPVLAGNLSPDFDGTEPPGTARNPGDEFFRPPDGTVQRVVKGRSVRMEIMAESQVPPGFDLYDSDNNGGGDRAKFKTRPYAAFIRKMDITVYPPGPNGKSADTPEKKANLFFFNSAADLSATVAPPPVATFEYVFREATSAPPGAKGKVADADRYYLVRLDVEDMAGNTRALKFPVWVTDEGLQTDKLSTEHQRK